MQYYSLQHRTLLPSSVTSTSGHFFSLSRRLFIISGVISPLFSSSILGTYQPGEFVFLCHFFLLFHTVRGVLKARILKWFPIPSPVDHVLSELSLGFLLEIFLVSQSKIVLLYTSFLELLLLHPIYPLPSPHLILFPKQPE